MTASSVFVGSVVGFVGLLAVATGQLGPADSLRVLLLQAVALTLIPFLFVQLAWRPFADGTERRTTRSSVAIGVIVAVLLAVFIGSSHWEEWNGWRAFIFNSLAFPLLAFALVQYVWKERPAGRVLGSYGVGGTPRVRKAVPRLLRQQVIQRDRNLCRYCGVYVTDPDIDHKVPVSRGGTNDKDNLVTACRRCNLDKGDRTPEEAGIPVLPIGTQAGAAPLHAQAGFSFGPPRQAFTRGKSRR